MSIKDQIRAEIERLYDGEAPKHDQQCDFDDGYFTGIGAISKFIDSLPDEQSGTYDTKNTTPQPSVGIDDVARVQYGAHAKRIDGKRRAVFDWEQFKEVVSIFYGFGKRDSTLSDEPKIEGIPQKVTLIPEGLEDEFAKFKELNRWGYHETDNKEFVCSNGWKLQVSDIMNIARHFAEWGKKQGYISKETVKKIAKGSLGVQDFIRKIDKYEEDK